MDTLVEDDICILNHEKAHRREAVTPLSAYPGDESVASHFALVTAYEDIKKRLTFPPLEVMTEVFVFPYLPIFSNFCEEKSTYFDVDCAESVNCLC